MKPKAILKIAVDIIMLLLLLALMASWMVGEETHEWAGVCMGVLFLIHLMLNIRWWSGIFKGNYTAFRIVQAVINVLLLVAMVLQMASGIVMSRYIFRRLSAAGGMMWARTVHHTGAYWSFVLISLHLGMHWNIVRNRIKRAVQVQGDSRGRTIALRIAAAGISLCGIAAFLQRDFAAYLFMRQMFTYFDDREPLFQFFVSYLAIMGLFTGIGHYAAVYLRSRAGKKRRDKNDEA